MGKKGMEIEGWNPAASEHEGETCMKSLLGSVVLGGYL
jgi:hypothetical protein